MRDTGEHVTDVKVNIQRTLFNFDYVNKNEPDIVGLHWNGYVWEYDYLPEGVYPKNPSEPIVRIWFHQSEGYR